MLLLEKWRRLIRSFCIVLSLLLTLSINAQNASSKKIMTPSVYGIWNTIQNVQISDNGDWVIYRLVPERGDATLKVYNTRTQKSYAFPRAEKAKIDVSGQYITFHAVASFDSVRAMKRRKLDKKDMPKDSLAIFNLNRNTVDKIPNVQSYKLPDKWSGIVVYQLEADESQADSTSTGKVKKESKENGSMLIVRRLDSGMEDTLGFVKNYVLAEEKPVIAAHSSGNDSLLTAGIYLYSDSKKSFSTIYTGKGDYYNLSVHPEGQMLSFIVDQDTSKARIRPYQLGFWSAEMEKAEIILDTDHQFLKGENMVNSHKTPEFSKDGSKLYFGINPIPRLRDSLLLEDEMANVEVWNYKDGRLYTQQNVRAEDDKKRSHLVVYHIGSGNFVRLGSEKITDVITTRDKNEKFLLGTDDRENLRKISWLGYAAEDIYKIDPTNGNATLLQKNASGYIQRSPSGKYAIWYNREDSLYVILDIETETKTIVSPPENSNFFDEENDRPMDPTSYGIAGWTKDESRVYIYDRYDIWSIDPTGNAEHMNLTGGRKNKWVYRYLNLNREQQYLPDDRMMLSLFDEKDKSGGYAKLDLDSGDITVLVSEPFLYSRPIKAEKSDALLITKESFRVFPNLILTDINLNNPKTISDANPQQSEYMWGDISLFKWKDKNGIERHGLLAVPDDFDPGKKYPMIVNFYERSSDRLHRHRAPQAHRSTINYTYYVNKGYIIFNPDVYYTNGYPGRSAEEAVFSGVNAVVKKGFVDTDRIGVQGHSWGGYQIAHLLTKTDMFACAEAGAPVVNMISAYGGIRWGSGMSRMFQYEKTQSRLGATLWENPELYIENSPVFNLDKVSTPVLILHNDMDGAVPWYQGIEYFVGLRRLNKPAWMLNYNDEPHWPLKWENRLDFNIRMEQFFAHYLLDAPMPLWMKEGVPAILKDVETGYELID